MITLAVIQGLLIALQLWHVVKLRRSRRQLDALIDELDQELL